MHDGGRRVKMTSDVPEANRTARRRRRYGRICEGALIFDITLRYSKFIIGTPPIVIIAIIYALIT